MGPDMALWQRYSEFNAGRAPTHSGRAPRRLLDCSWMLLSALSEHSAAGKEPVNRLSAAVKEASCERLPRSTLFPYTTLFRSGQVTHAHRQLTSELVAAQLKRQQPTEAAQAAR